AEAGNPSEFNHEFWAFTPANQHSAYLRRYQVRSGLANDSSFAVKNDLFTLHWQYLQSEVWVDSPGEWLTVVDGTAHYAMVERFPHFEGAEYPGKATVIFYKNGSAMELDHKGIPYITLANPEDALHYWEEAWSADCEHPVATGESSRSHRAARGTQSSGTNRAGFSSSDGSAGERPGFAWRSPGHSNGQEFLRRCGSV